MPNDKDILNYWSHHLPDRQTVVRTFGLRSFDAGFRLYSEGAVVKALAEIGRLRGVVQNGQAYRCIWQITEQGRLRLECTCRQKAYCKHQVALYLAAMESIRLQGAAPADPAARFLGLTDSNSYGRGAKARDLSSGSEEQLMGWLFPDLQAAEKPSPSHRLWIRVDVSKGGAKVEFLVDSPRAQKRVRSIDNTLSLWQTSKERNPTAWAPEDNRVLEYIHTRGWKYAFPTVSLLSELLAQLAGYPRLINRVDELARVHMESLDIRLEGEFRQRTLLVRPRLWFRDRALEVDRLFLIDGRLKWWYDGRNFYLHDSRRAPETIVGAASGKEIRVVQPRKIVELLRSGQVTLQGQTLEVRSEEVKPSLKLGFDGRRLVLDAALVGRHSGHSWPIDSEGRNWAEVGDGFLTCDRDRLIAVRQQILKHGFCEDGAPGRYFHEDLSILDKCLQTRPAMLGEYVLGLDNTLEELLDCRSSLQANLEADWDGEIDWFELKWRLEVDGEILSPADLKALRHFSGLYFRLETGKVVRVESERIRRQFGELEAIGYDPASGLPQRIPLHFAARLRKLADEPQQQYSSALADLQRKFESPQSVVSFAPVGRLAEVLRPYQKEGLSYLNFLAEHHFGGILADDMGLGKTVQTLALIDLHRRWLGTASNLIVCPTSVAPNWLEEAAKFTPELKAVHLRSSSELKECRIEQYDLVILSYALTRRNVFKPKFRFLVLDEAQNIKNPDTRSARAVKRIEAEHRLALTGTPIENSVLDLWSIFDFLMPGFLGPQGRFRRNYVKPIAAGPNLDQLDELTRRVRPFVLRRLKTEVAAELPPRIEQNIYCDLTGTQKRLYTELVAAARGEIREEVARKGWENSQICILAALTRLRQVCCHPGLLDPELGRLRSGKLEAFRETLDTILAGGHRVVVFSQFVKLLRLLERDLRRRKVPYVFLDGRTRDRKGRVEAFQRGKAPVFLMSLKAGGTGINLTAADYVILFDPWWNPAVENQAIDRTHRIGQDKPVTAYRLITRDTLEEKKLLLQARKQGLAASLGHVSREDLELLLG